MTLISDGFANKHSSENRKWKNVKTGFTHFQEGDIGIAKITPCFENRKSVIFNDLENGFGAGTTELHILRPNNEIVLTEFVFWIIKTENFIVTGIKNFAGAVGQQRVGKNIIAEFEIPLPPLPIQRQIVSQIETLFAEADRIEQSRNRLLRCVKLAKQKTLAELLNNEEWKTVKLGEVCDTIASKPYQILQSEILETGKIPVVSQSANYIEGYSNTTDKTLKIPTPVIVFGDHTRNVKLIDFDFIVGADGVKILVPKETILPNFFYYSVLFASENIENRGYSRHFQYLSKFEIPLPPLPVQRQIVEQIERIFAEIERIERAVK
jgi:type I restriction enzyme S subunit